MRRRQLRKSGASGHASTAPALRQPEPGTGTGSLGYLRCILVGLLRHLAPHLWPARRRRHHELAPWNVPLLRPAALRLHLPSMAFVSRRTWPFDFFGPSIVASGMGNTEVAVFVAITRRWQIPLSSIQPRVRYSYGRTNRSDWLGLFFTSDRFTVVFGGVGISIAGKPVDCLAETASPTD